MSVLETLATDLVAVAQAMHDVAAEADRAVTRLGSIARSVSSASAGSLAPEVRSIEGAMFEAMSACGATVRIFQSARQDLLSYLSVVHGATPDASISTGGFVGSGNPPAGGARSERTLGGVTEAVTVGMFNPGYSGIPSDPRGQNCGECAVGVYRYLNGEAAEPAGRWSYSDGDMAALLGRPQKVSEPGEIESALRAQGSGAHAIVGILRRRGPGHWFNVMFDGREVWAIDGQCGRVTPWPPDYGDVVQWDCSY